MRIVAIIQARINSSRLPAKVFADICGKPMLQRVIERVRKAKLLDNVVVATTFTEEDYQIVRWCQANQVPVYRGGTGENDVLGRFWDVAQYVGADVIVRVTADCPLMDAELLDSLITAFLQMEAGYACNVAPPTYPDGLDLEVFDWAMLNQAHLNATLPSDREHVTPWMRRALPIYNMSHDLDLSRLRFTVDEPADLEFVRAVYSELGEDFGMEDVLALLERRPELADINAHIGRNEGYRLSVEEENPTWNALD